MIEAMGETGAYQSEEDIRSSVGEGKLWPEDRGSLAFDARRALLRLVQGPFIDGSIQVELWKALLANRDAIEARLNDLFLELVLDDERFVAFARNVRVEEMQVPKAMRAIKMKLLDTIMVLSLRRELLLARSERVMITRSDLLDSLAQYRPVMKMDESAFKRRLEAAWTRLRESNILIAVQGSEDRFEISPVLAVVFGVEEAQAAHDAIESLLADDFMEEHDEVDVLISEQGDSEGEQRSKGRKGKKKSKGGSRA